MISAPGGDLFLRQWPGRHPALSPLIMFHDSLGCVELWRDFPGLLSDATGRSVIAYDRLGFGRSAANTAALQPDFTRHESSSALAAIRAALGIHAMIPFGYSVGGSVAMAAAAAYPGDTKAVITMAAQSFVEGRTLDGIRAARDHFCDPAQIERLARYHGDKASWVLGAWLDTWLAPAFADWTMDDDLRGVSCPVLAMHGDRDEYGSAAHPERMRRLCAGSCVVRMIPDCGHTPHREKPDVILTAVTEFLETIP